MSKKRPRPRQNAAIDARSASATHPAVAVGSRWPILASAALALGLAIYGLWFFWQPLTELPHAAGRPFRRIDLLLLLLTDANTVWADRWFGGSQGAILDRLPIAAARH